MTDTQKVAQLIINERTRRLGRLILKTAGVKPLDYIRLFISELLPDRELRQITIKRLFPNAYERIFPTGYVLFNIIVAEPCDAQPYYTGELIKYIRDRLNQFGIQINTVKREYLAGIKYPRYHGGFPVKTYEYVWNHQVYNVYDGTWDNGANDTFEDLPIFTSDHEFDGIILGLEMLETQSL